MLPRPLGSFSLPPATLAALSQAGYETFQDLSTSSANKLSEDLNISMAASQAILEVSRHRKMPLTQSAAFLASAAAKMYTLCPSVDRLIQGGLPKGHILEISGPPGSPKERLCLNIIKSVVEDSENVLFVDTQNMMNPATLEKSLTKSNHTESDYTGKIHHINIHTLPDLVVFMHNLMAYLNTHPKTSLLVLNSLSFLFQFSSSLTLSNRNGVLERIKVVLAQACASRNLTVVITSQLATKLLKPDGSPGTFDTGSKAVMAPSIGPSYLPSGRSHRIIIIPQSKSSGCLRLLSSPNYRSGKEPCPEEDYEIIDGVLR